MNSIRRLWQRASPNFLLVLVRFLLEPKDYTVRRKAVLKYYSKVDPATLPPEIAEGIKFLRSHKYTPLPYRWTRKYENFIPEVFRDESNQFLYVVYEGRTMYFPRRFTSTEVVWAVRAAMREQDNHSPHLYLTDDFHPEEGSIIVDAGVAEGNFALSVIEKAKRLYLIECDPEWMEALRLTFEPWKDKVVFVEKFMSDKPGENTTSLDELLSSEGEGNYFIKLDIEGYEQKALAGMKNLIESGNPVRMNVCTYHNPDDFTDIWSTLESYGFLCKATEGYVLFFHPGEKPEFRKVLIRAEKQRK
ncbi:MAG: FkbM family methyltransferase [Bacteroidales bacterium]|nr:FkbM family methyltransferase [Bacteroidales bacterium]